MLSLRLATHIAVRSRCRPHDAVRQVHVPNADEWLRASAARTSQPIVAYEAMASQKSAGVLEVFAFGLYAVFTISRLGDVTTRDESHDAASEDKSEHY